LSNASQHNTILILIFFSLLYFDIDMTFPQRNETAAVWEAERNAIGAWKIIEKLQNEKKKRIRKSNPIKLDSGRKYITSISEASSQLKCQFEPEFLSDWH